MQQRPVVFLDWLNVLSKDRYWSAITSDPTNRYAAVLMPAMKKVWRNPAEAAAWQRGELSTAEVLQRAGLSKEDSDDLSQALIDECATMSINVQLLDRVQRALPGSPLILATDNVDCFATALRQVFAQRETSDRSEATLRGQAFRFEGYLCSSDLSVSKLHDPQAFFGPTLEAAGLKFSDAVLIDDRPDNCRTFHELGGHAVRWMAGDKLELLTASLERTLIAVAPTHAPSRSSGFGPTL